MKISPAHLVRPLALTLLISAFSGCALLPSLSPPPPGKHAFIAHWPEKAQSGRLRLAVKDNIDMKGIVTTAGSEYLAKNSPPASQDAPALAIARERGVDIVGKTNLSEFAVSPSGINEYFGTPHSPLSSRFRRLLPGGSSCGSAVSVAVGMADVSFGTDTAGSVRVPAACCGVVGLKTTHGLVSVAGVHPIEAEHLDTVGPLGRNIAATAQGMDLLQRGFAARYSAAQASKPLAAQIRVGRLYVPGTDRAIDRAVDRALKKSGFEVVRLDADLVKAWQKATKDGNTIAAGGAWLSNAKYRDRPGIAVRTKAAILVGKLAYRRNYSAAVARQAQWQRTLRDTFQKVDLIALPTLKSPPPVFPPDLKIGLIEAFVLERQNTVAVNFAGNPALAVPIPLRSFGSRRSSLQFIGPRLSEAELLNAGRLVEASVRKGKN